MKRLLFFILNKLAALLGWRWLYLIAGLGILSSIQFCKSANNKRNCSVAPEKDSIVEPTCYYPGNEYFDALIPIEDSLVIPGEIIDLDSIKTNQKKPEIEKE